ncbi:flagellar basal body rod protein FlgB [Candidatus Phycosocius bacilliformis]|uniref:Flagellar basal body rod protein FlgB n=1 Tax=Candidatus Phycosocius bacilliformis TaxID=1445552 RepID=A0A2P2ECJ2_9PROT|nr:flagellar biosynthesis protein FlgB [Candidatus Phycosocius bacilliformis]GBF58773.1 flagellar basal body rod protein FlgB [Candidatus Phycosocius bacilliformis]
MGITNTPFFDVLRERMGFLNERQKLLAQNVANASTPKYVPKDLDERAFAEAVARQMPSARKGLAGAAPVMPVRMASTQSGHLDGGAPAAGAGRAIKAPDSEVTLDGNAVVLEEQMIKVADTRMNYDAALGLYQKGLQLMRLAARKPQ